MRYRSARDCGPRWIAFEFERVLEANLANPQGQLDQGCTFRLLMFLDQVQSWREVLLSSLFSLLEGKETKISKSSAIRAYIIYGFTKLAGCQLYFLFTKRFATWNRP